ncbi:MAG: sigma-E factor negative regulatory protein [Steroidobacteraceae bacterium]
MNEELDSQLSAMFDDELPAAQCELLARRLSRDEELRARWGRYAAIGATIRAEGGARLNAELARRVSVAIATEPEVIAEPVQPSSRLSRLRAARWWAPVGGVAVAASVAAAAILWVRFESGQVIAQATPGTPSGTTVAQSADSAAAENASDRYVVPKTIPRRSIVPSTQLANYVVAHSEFSSPVNRRNLLSALMASESGTAAAQSGSEEPTEDVNDDAKSPQ